MTPCDYCGATCDSVYTLSLEWPREDDNADDPGRASMTLCGECADETATDILVDRAVIQGLDDVYDGLTAGEVTA